MTSTDIIRTTGGRRDGAGGRPNQGRGTSDFTALAERIQARGLMRRRYGYYWTKLIGLPLAVLATIAVFIVVGDTWWQLITAAVFGILFAQVAFLGHDAAHRQIFVSGKANDWASLIIGDLFVGMSYGWWRHKHTRHHANPNKLETDPDIELPVVAVTPDRLLRARNPVLKWVMSHQGWFFFPLLLLEGLSLHASGIRRVLARERVDRRWVEILFLSIRLIGFIALAFVVLSPGLALRVPGCAAGRLRLLHGRHFRSEPQGHGDHPEGRQAGFPAPPGAHEPQRARPATARHRDGRTQLPDRASPLPLDAAPAPS